MSHVLEISSVRPCAEIDGVTVEGRIERPALVAPTKGKTGRPRTKLRLADGAAQWEAVAGVVATLPE